MMMLKAVILAGGRGIRLKPLTDTVPKPMIEINGKPFLRYQLDLLKKNKILEILLCVGYLKEQIVDYFGDGSRFGVRIEYSAEDSFLGTGGALKLGEKLLTEDFILLYGDSYLPIDYVKLIDFWRTSGKDFSGLLVCYDNTGNIAKNNIYLDREGIVKRYDKRGSGTGMNYVEAGAAILKKDIIRLIPGDKAASLEEDLFPILIREWALRGYPTNQRYYDIGTSQGLEAIRGVL